MRINIKPLSVNACYRGRRFKNDNYKAYETEMLLRLPPFDVPQGKLKVIIIFGYSNKASDIDNGVKILLDILQKHGGFNDKEIYKLEVTKEITEKGKEFIDFKIESYE